MVVRGAGFFKCFKRASVRSGSAVVWFSNVEAIFRWVAKASGMERSFISKG